MWVFTTVKAAVQCSHDCLAFTCRAVARSAGRVARLSQVQLCDSRVNFMGSRTVLSIAAAMQSSAR